MIYIHAGEAEKARAWNCDGRIGTEVLRGAAENREATGRRDRAIEAIIVVVEEW